MIDFFLAIQIVNGVVNYTKEIIIMKQIIKLNFKLFLLAAYPNLGNSATVLIQPLNNLEDGARIQILPFRHHWHGGRHRRFRLPLHHLTRQFRA